MDDLERIRELYGTRRPDPQAQGRVWRRVTGRRRRSRLSWLMIPAVAAAVALAFVVLHEPPVSGRSVLLAAATSAASVPGAEGTYWHIKKVRNGSEVTELWVARDGRAWTSDGERVSPVTGRSPFSMAGRDLTFEQIQGLPADPAALKERVAAMLPSNTPACSPTRSAVCCGPNRPLLRSAPPPTACWPSCPRCAIWVRALPARRSRTCWRTVTGARSSSMRRPRRCSPPPTAARRRAPSA
ncbi:hypothetical protein ACFQYP_53550 [Nonomuraea antimicrobica]